MSPLSKQVKRHFHFSAALTIAAIIFLYGTWVYLRYATRNGGHALEPEGIVIAWLFPGIFAVAACAGFAVTAMLHRGKELGFVRYMPFAIVLVGIPLQMALTRLVAHAQL